MYRSKDGNGQDIARVAMLSRQEKLSRGQQKRRRWGGRNKGDAVDKRGKEDIPGVQDLFVWLVGFLTSSSTSRLYRGRAPRQSV